MDDHTILTIGHFIEYWFAEFFITGGAGAALLVWWLSTRKKKTPHKSTYDLVQEHIIVDQASFARQDDVMTKILDRTQTIRESVARIEGHLNIN